MSRERDSGVALINALIIVLAIAALAAALLTRAEQARIRASDAQGAHQLALYLDGIEGLIPALLEDAAKGEAVHPGQAWASAGLRYPVDRGVVTARVVDLQGRLNVNWLIREDEYAKEVFARVFAELDVPQSLALEIADFVSPGGPGGTAGYLSRNPPLLPRGGPLASLDDLREMQGMTGEYFAILEPVLAALPSSSRVNLNTADEIVLKAVLAPLPAELVTEILDRDTPITAMSELRQRAIEILETEDIEDLPFDRMTIASNWFQAFLTADLDGLRQKRQVLFLVQPATEIPISLVNRWSVYD